MKAKLILLTFILFCMPIQASDLTEKAQVVDSMISASKQGELFDAFKSISGFKSMAAPLSQMDDKELLKNYAIRVEKRITEKLGETVIKSYSLEELLIIQKLFNGSKQERKFAQKLLCMAASKDPDFILMFLSGFTETLKENMDIIKERAKK